MQIGPYRIIADYHTHTAFSHGRGSVMENVAAARAKGLAAVAVTDHGPASLLGVGVASLATFDEIRREVLAARERYPEVEVLFGVEANVVSESGELDIPRPLQDRFDIVLVGLHPLVRWRSGRFGAALFARNALARRSDAWSREARRKNTRILVNAVVRNRVHGVTHPGYRLPVETRELARACAATGTAMEISGRHDHAPVEYVQAAKGEGALFFLGSDAHSPDRVGDVARAVRIAEAAGLKADDIVNVLPARARGRQTSAEVLRKGRERPHA